MRAKDGETLAYSNGEKEIQCEAKTSRARIVVTGKDNNDGLIQTEGKFLKSTMISNLTMKAKKKKNSSLPRFMSLRL